MTPVPKSDKWLCNFGGMAAQAQPWLPVKADICGLYIIWPFCFLHSHAPVFITC